MNLQFYKVIVICLVFGYSAVTHAGLIHSYDFNGNALDGTGTANGTVNGAVLTADRFGNANQAYLFNGESSITATFHSPNSASFSLWGALGRQSDFGDMLFSMNGITGVDLWIRETCNGAMWNTGDSCQNKFSGGDLNAVVRDGNFHHYVVVNDFTNNSTSLFVDGSLFGTATYKHVAGNNFVIGSWPHNNSYNWDGTIDDVKVYDEALNSTQIRNLFATGSVTSSVPEPSSIALFLISFFAIFLPRKTNLK